MTQVHWSIVIYPWTDAWGVFGGADRRPSVKVMCIFMRRECSLLHDTVARRYNQALPFESANFEAHPPKCFALISALLIEISSSLSCAFALPVWSLKSHYPADSNFM